MQGQTIIYTEWGSLEPDIESDEQLIQYDNHFKNRFAFFFVVRSGFCNICPQTSAVDISIIIMLDATMVGINIQWVALILSKFL